MIKNAISGFTFAFALLLAGTAFAVDTPTLHQVYEAANAGKLDEAEGMIQQVLKDHPDSAKAHFVDAEILVKAGHPAKAKEELSTAERLDPGLPFAKPQAVQALKAKVSENHVGISQKPISNYRPTQNEFPWGMFLLMIGAIVAITLIIRARTNRNLPQQNFPNLYPSGSGAPNSGGQYYPGGGYPPVAPGMGSGIMSSLATGAALGAGMVAGEALVHHFVDGSQGESYSSPSFTDSRTSDDMGGSDFGIADNSSWNDDSNIADISGGDDWS